MISLSNCGRNVEELFGPGRYLSTYLLAGAAGNLVSAYNSPNPALGASGAVFGIIGAQLVFLMRNEWLIGRQGEAMQTSMMSVGLVYGKNEICD
jgi:rhomboid protease GluP